VKSLIWGIFTGEDNLNPNYLNNTLEMSFANQPQMIATFLFGSFHHLNVIYYDYRQQ
jgi:hypothetical protein